MRKDAITCGPFELSEPIGQGGMGEIWRGRHRTLGVDVAAKFVARLAEADDRYRRMFRAEVRAHAGLNHPGIVQVLDYGEVDAAAEEASGGRLTAGSPYLITEFAPGGTLRELMPFEDWSAVTWVLMQVLDALAFAHARDVIHRDLKPENILSFSPVDAPAIEGPGALQLADFGIAHALYAHRGHAQEQGLDAETIAASAGTPHYMAPEQWRGQWRRFGPWTDLYQLGALTWELVCGRPPFDAASISSLGIAHVSKPLPPVEPRFAVPDELDAWLARMAAKRPEMRYQRTADAAFNLGRLGDPKRPSGHAAGLPGTSGIAPEELSNANTAVDSPTGRSWMSSLVTLVQSDTSPLPANEFDVTDWANTKPAPSAPESHAVPFERVPKNASNGERRRSFYRAPPVPASWKASLVGEPNLPLMGAGLGLFGLREVPFVDRDVQRDLVWQAVQEASGGATRALLIEGPSGVGKSRLAQWIARRAHEVGACQVFRAFHNPHGGSSDGLVGMVEDHFGTWGLERADVYELIAARLSAEAAIQSGDVYAERDARALTELLRPTSADTGPNDGARDGAGDGPRHRFASKTETFALLHRLLSYATSRRPALVWLDDVQWAGDALGWLEFILARRDQARRNQTGEMRAVFVMTARIDELAPTARQALARAREIAAGPGVERLSLQSLAPQDHAEFIARILALEPDLAAMVAERTEGNPLFAIQLIGDWVDRGQLTQSGGGFSLADEAKESVPSAIRQLWSRRLEHLLEALPLADQEPARVGLEIAAVLGREVVTDEWQRARRQAGVVPVRRLVERLAETGLATMKPGRWRFVHGLLVDSLQQMARAAGRWQAHHLACARMLAVAPMRRPVRQRARQAEHLVAGGEREAALEPLFDAVTSAIRGMDMDAAAALNERQLRLIDDLGLVADDPRRSLNELDRAEISCAQNLGEVKTYLERLEPVFEAAGDSSSLARVYLNMAKLTLQQGKLEEGERALDLADQHASSAPAEIRARIARGKGHAARFVGNYDAALAHFSRSRELYRAANLPGAALQIETDLIYVDTERGEYERAMQNALALIDEARRQGEMHTEVQFLNCLGEAAQHLDRWDEACHYFAEAVEVDRQLGNLSGEAVQRLNLGLSEIGRNDYDAARQQIELAQEIFDGLGMRRLAPLIAAGLAACDAGVGDWTGFDHHLAQIEAALAATDFRSSNQAWTVALATERAHRAGERARERSLLEIEQGIWRDLGRADQVARIEQDLKSPSR